MAVNKVIYDKTTLIDLTSDTVTEDTLLMGQTAHKADGSVITGALFADYPDKYYVYDTLLDSDGNAILDDNGESIESTVIYQKL